MHYKKLVTRVASHASAVSLLKSREQHYTKAIVISISIIGSSSRASYASHHLVSGAEVCGRRESLVALFVEVFDMVWKVWED